jgi:hypothetical protein
LPLFIGLWITARHSEVDVLYRFSFAFAPDRAATTVLGPNNAWLKNRLQCIECHGAVIGEADWTSVLATLRILAISSTQGHHWIWGVPAP